MFFFHQETGTIYTHHQKSIIVDAACGNRRKILAFVGGLDLCRGRYDTPQHELFSTLQTTHKDDYHNPNFLVTPLSMLLFMACGIFSIFSDKILYAPSAFLNCIN